jgi:hypothetical protein
MDIIRSGSNILSTCLKRKVTDNGIAVGGAQDSKPPHADPGIRDAPPLEFHEDQKKHMHLKELYQILGVLRKSNLKRLI